MLRAFKLAKRFCKVPKTTTNQTVIPAAPKLLPGQLQQFRYQREKQVLYEGYTQQQLFGARYGVKHSKQMKTQMMKDTIAALLILIGGFSLVVYNHQNFRKNLELHKRYVQHDLTKRDVIPEHAKTYPGLRIGVNPDIISQTKY